MQQRCHPARAVTAVLPGQRDDVLGERQLVICPVRHLALRRPVLAEHAAHPPLGHVQHFPDLEVAKRMVEALTGHDLFASAPSWDGKWLSVLLREAGLPRQALRLRDTEEALRATATEILRPVLPPARLDVEVHNIVTRASAAKNARPAHRALADPVGEHEIWLRARQPPVP